MTAVISHDLFTLQHPHMLEYGFCIFLHGVEVSIQWVFRDILIICSFPINASFSILVFPLSKPVPSRFSHSIIIINRIPCKLRNSPPLLLLQYWVIFSAVASRTCNLVAFIDRVSRPPCYIRQEDFGGRGCVTVHGMEICIEIFIPLICLDLLQCFFSTELGGGGGVTFTQGEQMTGAEGGSDSKKGRAEVESVFIGDGVCCWPHLWMWWRCVGGMNGVGDAGIKGKSACSKYSLPKASKCYKK